MIDIGNEPIETSYIHNSLSDSENISREESPIHNALLEESTFTGGHLEEFIFRGGVLSGTHYQWGFPMSFHTMSFRIHTNSPLSLNSLLAC